MSLRLISSRRNHGFTLVEVIVALVIFSIITVISFRALTFILEYVERDEAFYQEQNRMQRAWNIVLQDVLHMRPRVERDRLGGVTRAYQTDIDDYLVLLTRGGMPTITGTESGLQRIAYSVDEEGNFLRWSWPGMDRYEDLEPSSQVLIGGVSSVEFLQLNSSNEFEDSWPPLNEQLPDNALPRLVKLVINLENGDSVERIIPGVESPIAAERNRTNNRNDEEDLETGTETGIEDGVDAGEENQ